MKLNYFVFLSMVNFSFVANGEEPSTTHPALRGTPTVNGGECCQTLGEVRRHIDDLDTNIITLMAERQKYVHEAARFKANPAEVAAPARVDKVLDRIEKIASEQGLSTSVARATYRSMISEFIRYENEVFLNKKQN